MARARNIKPGFFKNEVLGVADPLYSLLFEGLWVLADREGRLEDRPLRIKGEVFPYRDGLNVDAMLNWLESNGFIQRYTAQGKKCILVLEFVKHQNPHKNEAESELPAPSTGCAKPEEIGTTSEIIGSTRAEGDPERPPHPPLLRRRRYHRRDDRDRLAALPRRTHDRRPQGQAVHRLARDLRELREVVVVRPLGMQRRRPRELDYQGSARKTSGGRPPR